MTMKTLKIAALAIAAPGLAMAMPAQAAVPASAYQTTQATHATTYEIESSNQWRDRYRDRDYRRYDRGRYDRHRDRDYRDRRTWRGRDGRYYCRKDDGTTGLLIGGAVGGVIGHEVAGRGDRTLGAILGAAGGALLGREIDRSGSRCR
ncbi:glycine zipper 2TM domain-containing protein [Pelagerythrobacter rhizovicinus]|nr:glycine zipper 2TM domain-containing protein [Pelagerythrobacter rhizovicinus]